MCAAAFLFAGIFSIFEMIPLGAGLDNDNKF
jgi:hypothetical protein